ncbi:MAG: NF038122 family metalloprotease [Candidatus Thermoplasmatota archaeon]|nr:NF038122 family metalloprotease [Candidatus Thermoplasmatota archaeon]
MINTVSSLAFREPGPTLQSRLYADGSIIELQTESLTWPILQNENIEMTQDQFKDLVRSAKKSFDSDSHRILINEGGSRALDIQFDVSSPPSGATAAINAVAAYIESKFSDPITVVINLDFESMGAGVLGSTASNYASSVTWTNTRNGLIDGMDTDDTIQSYLPSGSTIPVRYNGDSATITNENRCYFTLANYRSTVGSVSGDAADITMNSDFSWDYDPSNGISSGCYCFQSVLAHEVGHVLGFTSGADFRYWLQDIETLDVYRFQYSDGSGDYNPDTLAEFQTTARMVDQNCPGTNDDVISDIITLEYRMSDGDPYQCSHFAQGLVYGIMQPAIGSGATYYPEFYKTPDIVMFDAIGWDYVAPPDTTPPVTTCSLSGTLGTNSWYVSDVKVTLSATDPGKTGSGPSGVKQTYYKIDSSSWNIYTAPFTVSAEGQHTVSYYSDDNAGNIETTKTTSIKIDKTRPVITLTKQQIDPFTVKFMADANDGVSGIDRVDFSVSGALQYSDPSSPYEWTWVGFGNYSVTATAYDKAGNLQSDSSFTPVELIQERKSVEVQIGQHQ